MASSSSAGASATRNPDMSTDEALEIEAAQAAAELMEAEDALSGVGAARQPTSFARTRDYFFRVAAALHPRVGARCVLRKL